MGMSNIPLWGRAYKLTVKYASGPDTDSAAPQNAFEAAATGAAYTSETEVISQNSWEPEALRITFDVLESTLPSPYWYADISVYNLNDPEIQNLLVNATWATLSAGYQTGPSQSTVIWDGPVLQVLFDRENVTDFKVTFHCIASIPLINQNIVNFAFGPFSSQLNVVQKMLQQIGVPLKTSDTATQKLGAVQYPRGKSCFGTVSDYAFQVANSAFLNAWLDGTQVNISEMDSGQTPDQGSILTFSPPDPPGFNPGVQTKQVTKSIIGVPKQTPFGCIFRVLLDPRLKVQVPPMLVQLDRTVITQAAVQLNQVQTPLDPSLVFVAAQVRHSGDSRGQDWYSEVTAYSRTYAQGLLSGIFSSTTPGLVPLPGIS